MSDVIDVQRHERDEGTVVVLTMTDGPHPFTIVATADDGASGSGEGIVNSNGDRLVSVDIDPGTGEIGRGSSRVYTLTVTNHGTIADSYDLDVTIPAGWSGEVEVNGMVVDEIFVPPAPFNEYSAKLRITSSSTANPNDYDVTVTATSQGNDNVTASPYRVHTLGDCGNTRH